MRAIMEIINMKIVYHSPHRMQKSPPYPGGIGMRPETVCLYTILCILVKKIKEKVRTV